MITAALTLNVPKVFADNNQGFIDQLPDDKALALVDALMQKKQATKVVELFEAEIPQVKAVQDSRIQTKILILKSKEGLILEI